MTVDADNPEQSDVEFFGVRLKVKSPHLAALLNSSVTDDVQVIGRRARDVLVAENRPPRREGPSGERKPAEARAEGIPADGSVDFRLDDER